MMRILKNGLCLTLAFLMVFASMSVFAEGPETEEDAPQLLSAAEEPDASEGESEGEKEAERESRLAEIRDLLNSITYRTYRENYAEIPAATDTIHIDANSYDPAATTATVLLLDDVADSAGTVESGESLAIGEEGRVTFPFHVEKSARYSVLIRYLPVQTFTKDGVTITGYNSSAQRGLLFDDQYPFKESRYLEFPRIWQDQYQIDEDGKPHFEADESSDSDLRPPKKETPLWQSIYATDSTGYYLEEFSYYLEAGDHTLTLSEMQEPLMIRWIELVPPQTFKTYAEALAEYEQKGYAPAELSKEEYPKLDAEYADYTSAQVVYAVNDRTSAITEPQDPAHFYLNTIGGEKWNTVGQWVEWTVEIPKDGLYYIVPRSMQNVFDGVYSSRALYIDGEIPFYEAGFMQFSYSNEWKVEPLKSATGEDLKFYLTAGTHKIRLNVVLGEMGEVLAQVESVMNVMNSYYLEILKLTGPSPDNYRDYEFSKLMPDVLRGMVRQSERLYDIADQLAEVNGYSGEKTVTLSETALLLETMGLDEYKIAENFSNLNDKVSALGNWITDTRYQPLQIDYILFTPADENVVLPQAEAGFWDSLKFEFGAFVLSFFTDYNTMSESITEDSHDVVVVWMTTGRDQAQIIRSMVSDQFTAEKNIPINLKLVAGGLLQATLAGVGPDISLNQGADGIITYAIRNACISVEHMEGFEEVRKRFTTAAMIPLTLYGKVYGLPTTQGFSVLFYREDVLSGLGVEVPETWDDVFGIIPTLQNNNMQLGIPAVLTTYLYQTYASEENYRKGNLETPYGEQSQYENGVSDEYGIGYPYENGYKPGYLVKDAIYVMPDGTEFNLNYGSVVNLDGQNALQSFKRMCEFFTLYSFPMTYNFTNRFRTGEMPIGIQGYGFYSTLAVTAPELRGLWAFTKLPGTYNTNDDGTVSLNHRTHADVSAIMMVRGCGDDVTEEGKRVRADAWEFMKYWTSAEAQSRYGNELLALLGASGRHSTANLEALKSQPWPAKDRKNLEEAFGWVMATYSMPGGYISGRYVQFALLNVYNDAAAPIPAMLEYIDLINAEQTRKRKEFHLPTMENYDDYDYAAYFEEHYQIENAMGGHILENVPTLEEQTSEHLAAVERLKAAEKENA